MNYLTNYYKNLSEQLQHRANQLENEVRMINEAVSSMAANRRGAMGMDTGPMRGGAGSPGAFSGAQLGQLLGSGNMNAVNQYLGQYGQGGAYQAGPAMYRSSGPTVIRNRPRGVQSTDEDPGFAAGGQAEGPGYGGGVPGDYNGDGRVDGADLGMALGGGANTSNVLQNWSLPYAQQGSANISTGPSVAAARPRAGYASDVGPGRPRNSSPGAFSGAQLGQLLGSGNMDAVNQYLGQYGQGGAYQAGPASMRARSRRGAGR